MNWHKTAVVSRKPQFCVDNKRDAKFICDAKSTHNDYQEIGATRQLTAPLNLHITMVDGSVFYHPNNPTTLNPCDLGEFHINTQTESNSFTPKQKPTTITAAPSTQNYVLYQTIPSGPYNKYSTMLEPPAPN